VRIKPVDVCKPYNYCREILLARRIFELARELDVTSKVILTKCRAEGLEIKNHMSTLSAGLEATILDWFSEAGTGTAVETAEHVDLQRAQAEAKKRRRKKTKKADKKKQEPQEAEQEAQPATIAVADIEADIEAPPAEAPIEFADAEKAVAEAPAEVSEPEEPPTAAPAPARPEKKVIKPAGPQLVPRPAKLQGPRVVRVEKPDILRAPSYRRPAPPATAAGSTAIAPPPKHTKQAEETEDKGIHKKKAKRRSPRRRGGRTAESGEKLREWRDRDLAERTERLAAASGGGLRRHHAAISRRPGELHAALKAGPIEIEEPITVKSLSGATGIKSTAIIRKLRELGVMATLNHVIDHDVAETLLIDYDIELKVRRAMTAEDDLREQLESRPTGQTIPRAAVVTLLGHVDHGKTSLLDKIRHTGVAEGEAGGITQHIGAYRYDSDDKHVVFLDTPGHEAFTAMRARGANMTDVVVLVVAADDGVMPQTVEAINHARAAGVPIVVALNKIDVPNANIQRVLGQLAEQDLQVREWGGDVELIKTSAVTGEGIEELVEMLSLEAELLELEAEKDAPARGFVIEAKQDPGRGPLASLLVRNGTLRLGQILLAGGSYGRIRQMLDDHGRPISEAGPSTPVEVAGLDERPQAGDRFYVLSVLGQAKAVAAERRHRTRTKSLATGTPVTLENLFNRIKAGETNELAIIIKADVQGSLEAITGALEKIGTEEVRVNILHSAVGGISTGDVGLAEASGALIIGFNIVPDAAARQQAQAKGIDVRLYRVIYDLIDDIRKAMEEGLAPEIHEETIGHVEVRQLFRISRLGTVAGCHVTDGIVRRNSNLRITRDNVVIEDGRSLESLKRFKEDVREVRTGLECGLKITGYNDIKEGDVLEFYEQVEVARKL